MYYGKLKQKRDDNNNNNKKKKLKQKNIMVMKDFFHVQCNETLWRIDTMNLKHSA